MKKFVLRDEYVAPSRAELKAFIDEEFNGKEADERKANISIENAKSGIYEARDYEYLDGSVIHLEAKEVVKRNEIEGRLFNSGIQADKCVKYEGRIYEREGELSFNINNDKDIEIVVPKFVRDYRLVGNYVGICHQNLMAMAKAGIMPVMAGVKCGISWEVNNNDEDFIGQSSRNYNHEMIDEIVERGIKWSKLMYGGVDASRAFAKSWVNDNHIEKVEEYEFENKSIFKVRKFKGELVKVYGVKKSSLIEKESMNAGESFKGDSYGKMEKSYRKVYVLNNRGMEDDKEEIVDWEKRYVRSEIEGGLVEVMSAVEEFKEVNKFRYDRNDIIQEDMKGIMKNSKYDENISANIEHSLFELKANKNKYINSNGKYLKEGEIFSINHSHDNMRSGKEEARIRMNERNNNLNKNIGGKYWSAVLNKWISY